MNSRNRILASFGALALMASTVIPSVADSTSSGRADVDVSVKGIEGATVSISIEESSENTFDDVTYNYSEATTSEGDLIVRVTDDRGTAAGWNVTLQGTDFKRANTSVGQDIGIDNLGLVPGKPSRVSTAGTIPTTVFAIPKMSSSESSGLWVAAEDQGDGIFETVVGGKLNIPAGTLVDSYTSTITAVITFAP